MLNLNQQLQNKITKFNKFPKWSAQFPPIIEKHYHDRILVYVSDRLNPNNNYSIKYSNNSVIPNLIEIYFDEQPVFIKCNQKVILNRIPERV